MNAQQKLAQYNITLEQANSFVMDNVDKPNTIFNVALEFGITSSMLAEIVSLSIPSATVEMVEQFFAANGKDASELNVDATDAIDVPDVTVDGSYVNTADHAFDDGFNNGYMQGFVEHILPGVQFGTLFSSNELSALFPINYDKGFNIGYGDGFKDGDYTEYFITSSDDPALSDQVDLATMAKASGYLDGYKDGLVENLSKQFGGDFDYVAYAPENIEGYLAPYNQGYDEGLADGAVLNSYDHFHYDMSQVIHMADLFA